MAFWDGSFLTTELSHQTSCFGLRLWVLIAISVGVAIVLVLFILSICLAFRRRRTLSPPSHKTLKHHLHDSTPAISKEILEIFRLNSPPRAAAAAPPITEIQVDIGKENHHVVFSDHKGHAPLPSSSTASAESRSTAADFTVSPKGIGGPPEVSHLGWGHWYTLRELEEATGGFVDENVIGEGGYGIVYRGVLPDNTMVAIKNLLNNRGQAEKEFRVEVEAIGRVRHKNLVRLLGYCVEGAHRMLVYEYVDNGNLDQWIHGDIGAATPLTWEIRMNIILGTAKGLAYLHEGLEPKVVHRDVKSSNILLDRHWNSKVSDFGLAKLLCSERSYVTTRVMGTFGYVAPEYASTGMLNERSDVYSFGVLIMEIISGRTPVDYSRPPGEVNLVDWLKNLVGERRYEEVADPKILVKPSSKSLKRALLVALRCVDPDAIKRPRMGHVIHMLEMEDFSAREDRKHGREASNNVNPTTKVGKKIELLSRQAMNIK
ncbi:probable serine/threonine-protein kinase At1g01540 [Phalaenopsis equestris]|uniref:probable serine/threonine-protein kinase At1g01540 n=1 Tax=Phalaenopsis equestris TaxID=78828 RepID=UPI0009E5AE1E|nr:probable serine/threonine-protein kinase At1g01540 [Phalaenopsis equestris]